jgi:hypothetical protein
MPNDPKGPEREKQQVNHEANDDRRQPEQSIDEHVKAARPWKL